MKLLLNKKLTVFLFVVALSLFGNDDYSIECNVTTNYSEQMICNDKFLLNLDLIMNENYKHMFNSNIGNGARNDLRETQKGWLLKRNQCQDKKCIINLYKSRLSDICAYPVITGVHPVCKYYSELGK